MQKKLEDSLKELKTGDLILFSSTSPSTFIIKLFSSSEWTHVGLVIRLLDDKTVSHNNKGEIYILETNPRKTYDYVFKNEAKGIYFSKFDTIKHFHTKIMIRKLGSKFFNDKFCEDVYNYAFLNKNLEYPKSVSAFIYPLIRYSPEKEYDHMICSEFVANIYIQTLNIDLKTLINDSYPDKPEFCIPDHFETYFNYILEKGDVFFLNKIDFLSIIIFPLLLILFIMILIYMTLPGVFKKDKKINSNKNKENLISYFIL